MTFGKVICAYCNNTFTQPFDFAYESLTAWFAKNRKKLIADRRLVFPEIFGDDWEQSQLDLFRYFAKHLGCHIAATNSHEVPKDLSELLYTSPFNTGLVVTFQIDEDLAILPGIGDGLQVGALGCYPPTEDFGFQYQSSIAVGCLVAGLWYLTQAPLDATRWIANQPALALGSQRTFTDSEVQELQRRMAGEAHRPIFPGEV